MNSQIKKLNLKNAKPSKKAGKRNKPIKKNQFFFPIQHCKNKITGDYEIGFSFLISRLYTEREKNSAFPIFSQPITLRVF